MVMDTKRNIASTRMPPYTNIQHHDMSGLATHLSEGLAVHPKDTHLLLNKEHIAGSTNKTPSMYSHMQLETVLSQHGACPQDPLVVA